MPDSILWQRLDLPGYEIASLVRRNSDWRMFGTAIFVHEEMPCRLDYEISCDASWRSMSARVNGSIGDREVDVNIVVDAKHRWLLNGTECAAVRGCTDVDLAFTPCTNLIPVNRLALKIGQEAEVKAAWLTFPALSLEILPQLYRRELEHTYHYESDNGAFVRKLEVNSAGFVASYPGLWHAVWSSSE